MKALSIKQPWASLIATPRKDDPTKGIKDIENRTWRTHYRGKIYIHASGKKVNFDNWYDSPLNNEQLLSLPTANYGLDFHYSAIIGEVDIIDCIENHKSIWAEASEFNLGFEPDKIIYHWVLANPVIYDKPILNVKGSLSLWDWKGYDQTCESCQNVFDIQNMLSDNDSNWFCKSCYEELSPVWQKEYEEMKAKGEID